MACISSSWLNYLLFSPLLLSSTENVNIWDCWGELAVFSYLLSVLDANLIWGYLTKNRICYLSLYPVDESAQGASTPAGCIMNNFLGLLLLGSHFCLYIGLPLFPLVVIITFFGRVMYSESTKKYFLFLFKLIFQSSKKFRFFSCLLSHSRLVWYDLSSYFSTRNPFRPNYKLLELSAFRYFLDFRILQVVISSC